MISNRPFRSGQHPFVALLLLREAVPASSSRTTLRLCWANSWPTGILV